MYKINKVLITGGAGFIGSNFIEYYLRKHSDRNIICVDKLTYAGKLENIEDFFLILILSFIKKIYVTKVE